MPYKPLYVPEPTLYYFDTASADRAIKFVEKHLVYPTTSVGCDAGDPIRLFPWQVDYIRYVFGWKHIKDDSRMVRETCLFIAKKNGKTTLTSVINCILLFADDDTDQNIVSIAPSKEQADLCFTYAKEMILQSPTLGELVTNKQIVIRKDFIFVPSTRNRYSVKSGSAQTIHGPSISACTLDEVHALKSRNLYTAIKGAGKSRKSPLKVYMSTAGWDRTTICYELWEYGQKIIDGSAINPSFYPLIFQPDAKKLEANPEYWEG